MGQASKQSASHSRYYLSSINKVKPGDDGDKENCTHFVLH